MQHLKAFYRATASLAVLVFLSFPSASAGQVYRCVDAAGKVTFSDQGCADGHSSSAIDVAPRTPSTARSTEVRCLNLRCHIALRLRCGLAFKSTSSGATTMQNVSGKGFAKRPRRPIPDLVEG